MKIDGERRKSLKLFDDSINEWKAKIVSVRNKF